MKNCAPIGNELSAAVPSVDGRPTLGAWVDEAVHRLKELDHALRTPVGAMVVAVELLQAAPDEATRSEACQVLGRQLQRVRELLDGLHEVTLALEAGAPPRPLKE